MNRVGDVVGPVHDLRLDALGSWDRAEPQPVEDLAVVFVEAELRVLGRARPRVLRRGVEGRAGQVQPDAATVGVDDLRLEAGQDAQALRVAPRTRRTCRRTLRALALRCDRTVGDPRSCARQAVSTRSGSAPSAPASSRPICAHSREWVSRVRGKSLSPTPTTCVRAASRRSAAECMTRALSRTNEPRNRALGLFGLVHSTRARDARRTRPSNHTRAVLVVVAEDLVVDVRLGLPRDVAELDATGPRTAGPVALRATCRPRCPRSRAIVRARRQCHGSVTITAVCQSWAPEGGLHRAAGCATCHVPVCSATSADLGTPCWWR